MKKAGKCKSCDAEIIWVTMYESKKKMPLDAKPEKRVIIVGGNEVGVMRDTYISHFATCPDAKKHRKKK